MTRRNDRQPAFRSFATDGMCHFEGARVAAVAIDTRRHARVLGALIASGLLAMMMMGMAAAVAQGEEPKATSPSAGKSNSPEIIAQRIQALTEQLANSVFVGRFSIDGKPEMQEDRYEIEGAAKLPGGDLWLIKTRIRYGDHDVSVPLPINIRWANDTPVITVDQLTVPGLGTFDARVVISGSRYAGTWQHGDVGGHMIGRIEKADKNAEKTGEPAPAK